MTYGMAGPSKQRIISPRLLLSLSASLFSTGVVTLAAPAEMIISQSLEKRKATLGKSDAITIDGKAPLDCILLIGFGLLMALICLFIALYNVYWPNASNGGIREERARATAELKLKGAGGGGSGWADGSNGNAISPILRNVAEKKHQHYVGADNNTSTKRDSFRVDLAPSYTARRERPSGPRVAPEANTARSSRASRAYNAYTKHLDMEKEPSTGSSTPASLLALPVLPAAYADDYSTPSSSTSSTSPIPTTPTWYNRPSIDHNRSHLSHTRQFSSSSIARGIDLNRKRKSLRYTKNLIDTPELMMDSANSPQRGTSPALGLANMSNVSKDPLIGASLHRYPGETMRTPMNKEGSINAYEYYSNLSSDMLHAGSYDHSNLSRPIANPYNTLPNPYQQEEVASPVRQANPTRSVGSINRSRPLAFYDLEQDTSIHQDTALLDQNSPSKQSPRKLWAQF